MAWIMMYGVEFGLTVNSSAGVVECCRSVGSPGTARSMAQAAMNTSEDPFSGDRIHRKRHHTIQAEREFESCCRCAPASLAAESRRQHGAGIIQTQILVSFFPVVLAL